MPKKRLEADNKVVFDQLSQQLPGVEFVEFFDGGSTARVYHVRIPVGPNMGSGINRIIKVFRSKKELKHDIDPDQIFQNEVTKLISISHSNVISVFSAGYLDVHEEKLPYYVMEYLPGARDFDEWLKAHGRELNRETIIQLLLQAARGIEALHLEGIVHCDLKFGNMFVGASGQLKIADLGFSKLISGKTGKTGLFTTDKYFPSCYHKHLAELKDKRQMHVELPREHLNASFDLHYFGKIIHDLLISPLITPLLTQSDHKCLMLLIDRLNLDCSSASLPHYEKMGQVIRDLEKMQSLYINRAGVEELSTYTGTRTLRIPVTGNIPFTERVARIIHHPTFFRLNNVHQLGFSHYVFPGATHTRLEHSLGVYANVSKYINSLLTDDHQPYFRQLVDDEMIVTALLAGLLHDIGQHSYAHSLEDFGLCDSHESVAKMFIDGRDIEKTFSRPEYKDSLEDVIKSCWPEVNKDLLFWLITGKRERGVTIELGWEIIRAILSGPIDADKTDYLLRDAYHAGVEYARSIDTTRLMNSLSASLVKDKDYTKGVLAFTWKGSQSAENIVLARSQMFWVLYWHHAVRSAHAMLAHACTSHLKSLSEDDRRIYNDVLYWGTIGELLTYLKASENERTRELAEWLRMRRIFKRGISLNYSDDKELYDALQRKKIQCENDGDNLMLGMSRDIAEQINKKLDIRRPALRLTPNDVIVDIPRAGKDRLGVIYIVEKGADMATPYHSRGLLGSLDDWENRVRTVRIFVDPRIDPDTRRKISGQSRRILQEIT